MYLLSFLGENSHPLLHSRERVPILMRVPHPPQAFVAHQTDADRQPQDTADMIGTLIHIDLVLFRARGLHVDTEQDPDPSHLCPLARREDVEDDEIALAAT